MLKYLIKILVFATIAVATILLIIVTVVGIAKAINIHNAKSRTAEGISENRYIELGEIEQYIQIKGENKSNPIIVFLHGGPGNPNSHLSYYFQPYLTADYTFVDWDQRGCGKTYFKNTGMDISDELSTEQLLSDLDELVDYLRERFAQDKIIIMGHSWGTLLGSKYVLEQPEKVSAYIGVGQVVSLQQGYLHSANTAIDKASEQDKMEIGNKLEVKVKTFEQTNSLSNFDFMNFLQMQALTMQFNPYEGQQSTSKMFWTMFTSPDFDINSFKWLIKSNNPAELMRLQAPLIEDCFFNLNLYDFGATYRVPVHYISGEFDVSTPIDLVKPYFEQMNAPQKSLTVIKNTGHLPFMDNSQEFADAVTAIMEQIEK